MAESITESASRDVDPRASRVRFVLRKLHSVSGVFPVGLFVVTHLLINATATNGEARYRALVGSLQRIPFVQAIEVALILAPLAFHAGFGVVLALESRFNISQYPKNRNWMFVAQRVSGFLALAFIVWHLGENWLPYQRGLVSSADFHARLTARLSSTWRGLPLVAFAYLLGIGATVFHLANGLWGFLFSWGLAPRKRARDVAALAFGLAGLALFLVAANTAIYFATGASVIPGRASPESLRGSQATP